MKAMLLAAMLLSGQAVPDAFCEDVRALHQAAGEKPAFASVAGRNLDSLLGSTCRADNPATDNFLCARQLTPQGHSKEPLTARILVCLPEAKVTKAAYPDEGNIIRAGSLEIKVSEFGGPGAHVGRSMILYIRGLSAAE